MPATVALPAAFVEEERGARVRRRLASVAGILAAAAAVASLLPLLLAVALLSDILRRKPLVACRCVAMLAVYLACEVIGLAAAAALALRRLAGGIDGGRWLDLNYAVQRRWAAALLAAARAIFSLRFEIDGEEEIGGEPLLVFMRHASIADTLLPAHLLAARHGYRLRYVLKRELLWDPCLDIVGNRLPNVFVRRGSSDGAREIDAIRRLANSLEPRQGVLIYPEGTRFTAAKRARALERLAARQPQRLPAARAMTHVLPPHLGGPLALLEGGSRADVLFVAHTGLEGAATLGDIWAGALVGRTVRVRLWRVARAAIPAGRAERTAWLDREWARVDAWCAGA